MVWKIGSHNFTREMRNDTQNVAWKSRSGCQNIESATTYTSTMQMQSDWPS